MSRLCVIAETQPAAESIAEDLAVVGIDVEPASCATATATALRRLRFDVAFVDARVLQDASAGSLVRITAHVQYARVVEVAR